MAGRKGRSGRKKKTATPTAKNQPAKMQVTVLPPAPPAPAPAPVPEGMEVEQAPGLLEGVKDKIKSLVSPTAITSSGTTESSESSAPAEFEVIAERMEEKYGGAPGAPEGEQVPPSSDPPFSVNPGVAHVVTPETVEAFLVMVLTGLEKTYGPQWHPSESDKTVLVPVYTAAIDEQAPRWFADSQNKALWVCVFVTVLYIVSRSKTGGRLVEWGMDKVGSLVSKMGGSTKTDSPE